MEIIGIRGLYKEYDNAGRRIEVLKGIDLGIERGETIAIVGASGAGKSTLLNIMGALDRPTRGGVFYGERDLAGMGDRDIAGFRNRTIGFVFQSHHLLPEFSALENVMMPAIIGGVPQREARLRAEALLSEVGLGQRLDHKPGELSGGEAQRTAIGRALVQSPQVILADEPTGNLDTQTGSEVFELLLRLNADKGTTLVIVTHNEAIAGRLKRVVRIKDGSISEGALPH
jgi:lipoprotein-releasing system ATP-binding protein